MPDLLAAGDLVVVRSSSGTRICVVLKVYPWRREPDDDKIITLSGFMPAPEELMALLQPLYEELNQRANGATPEGWIKNGHCVLIHPNIDNPRWGYTLQRIIDEGKVLNAILM